MKYITDKNFAGIYKKVPTNKTYELITDLRTLNGQNNRPVNKPVNRPIKDHFRIGVITSNYLLLCKIKFFIYHRLIKHITGGVK